LCRRLPQADAAVASAEQQYKARLNTTKVGGDVELF
jgi:hypothetical protein